jgi:hypothetical protein
VSTAADIGAPLANLGHLVCDWLPRDHALTPGGILDLLPAAGLRHRGTGSANGQGLAGMTQHWPAAQNCQPLPHTCQQQKTGAMQPAAVPPPLLLSTSPGSHAPPREQQPRAAPPPSLPPTGPRLRSPSDAASPVHMMAPQCPEFVQHSMAGGIAEHTPQRKCRCSAQEAHTSAGYATPMHMPRSRCNS